MKRKIIIGDPHGCYDEVVALLDACQFKPTTDTLYFTGDLINRGPNSLGCYELYKRYSAQCPLGNHEREILLAEKGLCGHSPRNDMLKAAFGNATYRKFIDDIESWPLWIEEDEFVLVHAGLLPGKSPKECDALTLTTIRNATDPNNPAIEKPWYEFYTKTKPIVFGHWSLLGGVTKKNVYGIDMGCVYGKSLRAVIFPGGQTVEVSAKRTYHDPFQKALNKP